MPAATSTTVRLVVTGLRLVVGWVLLWAGLDKVFGLGYATPASQSVLHGASPTKGFLSGGIPAGSPAHGLLTPLAGNPVVDVLYLLATLGAGLALVLGAGIRVAAAGGALLLLSLWFASMPLENNPLVDEHLVYVMALVVVAVLDDGRYGLGGWWRRTPVVQRAPWLG